MEFDIFMNIKENSTVSVLVITNKIYRLLLSKSMCNPLKNIKWS